MARIPRSITVTKDQSVHKVWRGHNKEWNLGKDEDKLKYLKFQIQDYVKYEADKGAELHAFCLMSNHAHEVYHVKDQPEFSNHMRRHHGRYGQYFNKKNGRSGKVAEDRPKTNAIQDGDHEMTTIFYIHANPIRANIVKDARNYLWSTHNLYAFGKRPKWMKHVKFPKWYLSLGRNATQRQKKYRKLFASYLKRTGRFKQDFIKKLFIGTDLWIENKRREVLKIFKSRAPSG
jgi:putative transposase